MPDNALFRIGGEPAKAVLGLIPPAKHEPGYATNPPASQLPHDIIVNRLNALPEEERRRVLPQLEQALKQRGFKFYTEDEWRNSEHHRDMPFEPFMTVERAKAKAEIFDANRAREWLIAHRPDGALSGTLGFLASTVGGLADPTTLAGGIGGKLVMNLGRTGVASLLKGAGIGAADGGISSLAHDYSLRQSLAKWGEQHSDGEIWENAGWATLIGGGLGGGFQGARMLRAKPGEPAGGGLRIKQSDDPRLPQNPAIAPNGSADIPISGASTSPPTTTPALDIKSGAGVSPKTLFHYTDERGLAGILETRKLNPSLKALNPKDARHGDGQYFTDIAPGTLTARQLAHALVRNANMSHRFTHFVEVDPSQLNVVKGRNNVYVILNSDALDLTDRVIRHGEHRWNTSK